MCIFKKLPVSKCEVNFSKTNGTYRQETIFQNCGYKNNRLSTEKDFFLQIWQTIWIAANFIHTWFLKVVLSISSILTSTLKTPQTPWEKRSFLALSET